MWKIRINFKKISVAFFLDHTITTSTICVRLNDRTANRSVCLWYGVQCTFFWTWWFLTHTRAIFCHPASTDSSSTIPNVGFKLPPTVTHSPLRQPPDDDDDNEEEEAQLALRRPQRVRRRPRCGTGSHYFDDWLYLFVSACLHHDSAHLCSVFFSPVGRLIIEHLTTLIHFILNLNY